MFIEGLGAVRVGDRAGGIISGPGIGTVTVNGLAISVEGDVVAPHGTRKHASAKTAGPSRSVRIWEEIAAANISGTESYVVASAGTLVAGNPLGWIGKWFQDRLQDAQNAMDFLQVLGASLRPPGLPPGAVQEANYILCRANAGAVGAGASLVITSPAWATSDATIVGIPLGVVIKSGAVISGSVFGYQASAPLCESIYKGKQIITPEAMMMQSGDGYNRPRPRPEGAGGSGANPPRPRPESTGGSGRGGSGTGTTWVNGVEYRIVPKGTLNRGVTPNNFRSTQNDYIDEKYIPKLIERLKNPADRIYIKPIEVTRTGEVIDGHHTLEAMKRAGIKIEIDDYIIVEPMP